MDKRTDVVTEPGSVDWTGAGECPRKCKKKKKKVQKLDTASLEGSLVFQVNSFCLTHFEFKIVAR